MPQNVSDLIEGIGTLPVRRCVINRGRAGILAHVNPAEMVVEHPTKDLFVFERIT